MRKWLGIALAGLVALAWTASAQAETKYAVCVGLNTYSLSGAGDLTGCVNDASYFYTNLVERGGWSTANITKLLNGSAKKTAIRKAISNYAAKAVSGDTFVYQHSSHGGQNSGRSVFLCAYDDYYEDTEVAADLRSFASGVKVIVVVDACHSGGLFMGDSGKARKAAAEFDLAGRVTELMNADRALRKARGEAVEKSLSAKEIGWVTAANYTESSLDGGFYHTGEWVTNNAYGEEYWNDRKSDYDYPSSYVLGGVFLGAFTWSWWNGTGDANSGYGDNDGYADAYECWKEAYDFCTKYGTFKSAVNDAYDKSYNFTPQCTNITVLRSVELGWAGKDEPGGVRFAPIPAQTATVGVPLAYTLVASNADGSTGTITYSVASSTAPSGSYSLSGANFTFTPPADGAFTFDFLATNTTAKTSGKASMNVSASLAAPTGLANSGVTDSSFTASWGAVPGAVSYVLEVFADNEASASAKSADGSFALVTSEDGLTEGEYVIVAENDDVAMDNTCSGASSGYLSCIDVSVDGSSLSTEDASIIWTLAGDASSCTLFNAAAGKFANPSTSKAAIGWSDTASGAWTLSLDEGIVSAANAASTEWKLQYNSNTPRFTTYKSTQKDLRFFRRDGASGAVFSADVGNVTSFMVTDLIPGDYTWRVRAVGNAKGPWSETKDVPLVADPSAPPSIRPVADIEIDVGETATAEIKVSAPEAAPVTSIEITAGDATAKLSDGVFSFAPEAPGTYDFTITAVNANGPASESFAVIASLAEPKTPETPSDVTSESFTAVWEGVPGASSYELVVIEGQGGSSGGGGGESGGDFTLVTSASGLTAGDYVILGENADNAMNNACSGTSSGNLGYAEVTVSGSTVSTEDASIIWTLAGDASSCTLFNADAGKFVNPATTRACGWSDTASGSWTLSVDDSIVSAANAASTKWKLQYNSGSPRFAMYESTQKDLRFFRRGSAKSIAKAVGDVVFSNNVGNVTSYEVTGLHSSTEYTFAFRAVAENGETTDWSAPVTVKTDDGPSSPVWSTIPAQHTYVGFTFQLDLSGYLSGSPTPAVTADIGTVTGLSYVYEPADVGPVTVTLTAVNDSGTATNSFTLAVDEPPVGGNHYAVIVGCNKYDQDYIEDNDLNGCVPDANHVQSLITSRGQWEAANVTKLTDSAAKHSAVLSAIAAAAAQAVPGDTFLYFHSSHGGNSNASYVTNTALYSDWPILVYDVDPEGAKNVICTHDADFTAAELASALAAFDPAVNIVVMLDTCHSAGMFQYNGTPVSQRVIRRKAGGTALRSADASLFAQAVGDQLGAIRRARGIRAASNVAFVTAANFDEYSLDSESGDGGEFTTAFIDGITNGLCDGTGYGDQDGWATFYEGWNYAKDIAVGMSVGTEVYGYVTAVDENGYALYDNSYWAALYEDEPEYYYDYCFAHPQIDNEALLRAVRVGYAGNPTLAAPVANPAAVVTASSFAASWSAVEGATGYRLQVATDSSFSTGVSADTILVDDLAATMNSYIEFSGVSKNSGAVYAGKSAKSGKGAIQLNNSKSAGIWTTASGGNVSRVAVVWNGETADGRTLKIYGSDTALASYSAVTAAKPVGSIVCGTDTAFDIDGSYAYVGIVPTGGAVYLDSIEFDWGTAGSGSSIVIDQDVGNVTSHEVTGLEAETDYWYRVQALGDPVDSDFSNVIALTTDGGTPSPPVWGEIPPQTAVAGEDLVVDLKPYVTGSPKPTITADAGTVAIGVLTVSYAAPGDHTINLTAENSEGSDTATLDVSVTAGPVYVPTLALSNPTSEGFDASWDACTGVSRYTLQIATDDQFTTGGSGGEVELFANPASSVTPPAGWTYAIANTSGKYLQLTKTENSVVSPAVSTKGLSSLTVSFEMRTYGGVSGESGTALVEYSADGSTWSEVGTATAANTTMTKKTVDAAAAIGLDSVQFRWTAPNAVGGKGIGIQSLVLKGEATAGEGSLVKELPVAETSTTVTGLEPETLYYARVKGSADWSAVESITTLSDEPSAPVWLEIPAQTATVDLEFGIDLSSYVTGNPFPAIFVDGQETDGGAWAATFVEAKTNTYALLASNSLGTAEATLTIVVSEAPPAKYAVCVGLSEYNKAAYDAMGLGVTPLEGCVNDATYMKKNLTERGGWAEADVALLANGSATKDAIRAAISNVAAKAVAGDTFVYQHSSHGLQGDDDDEFHVALAAYENLYKDYELAEDLAAFADGVKVVILIDSCHSAGMFGDGDGGDAGPAGKARSAASFDIARRVSALMDANRAVRRARGEDVSRTLSADQVGWVTAATYEETSKDAGYYDTDKWMYDDKADGEEHGGAFLASIAWGWWSGKADVSGEGDGDGWFDAYEGWSFSTPVCAEYDQTPQYLNEDVLRSVELGWVGVTAPSEAIVFDPVPGASVAIGEEATLTVVARNADGTTDGITLSVAATDPEGLDYGFAAGTLTFRPAEDGIFLFTVQAVNGGATATKILGVSAALPAPVAQEVEEADIREDGFTARWLGVDAAQNYQIQVSTSDSFPMEEPDMLIEEGFDGVTNKASLTEKGWTFEGGTFATYTGKGYYGESSPSIKISSNGTNILTSPTFKLDRAKNGIGFWTLCNSTDPTSTVTVELLVGGEWKELDSFVPSPAGEMKEYENIDPSATQVRFVVDKASGNVAIDDVKVAQAKGAVVVDDEKIPAGATSYEVKKLMPGTTYHFRIRARGANSKSAWSAVIPVTTSGEAPIPVPELLLAPVETAPDTSIFAVWVCSGVSQYRLQVATDGEFAAPVFDEELDEDTKVVTGLTPETTYYVRVCALDGERSGDWSEVQSLTTASSGPVPPPSEAGITGMTIDDGKMTITFVGEGAQVLLSSDLVDWTPVNGAISPYTIEMGEGPQYIGVR